MKRKSKKADAARIQKAVSGLQIPMMAIPKLYAHAEKMIAEGATDEQLAQGVREYLFLTSPIPS